MAPVPIVDLQFSIQGMLVLLVGGEAVLTVSGEAGDFVEVQSGQTVVYTYNAATSLFTVTVGGESFTTSNFSALFAGENVLVSDTTSGSITASLGGALYRDSNIVLFTNDTELIQEIAIRQDTGVIPPTMVPTAADSSSWGERLGVSTHDSTSTHNITCLLLLHALLYRQRLTRHPVIFAQFKPF